MHVIIYNNLISLVVAVFVVVVFCRSLVLRCLIFVCLLFFCHIYFGWIINCCRFSHPSIRCPESKFQSCLMAITFLFIHLSRLRNLYSFFGNRFSIISNFILWIFNLNTSIIIINVIIISLYRSIRRQMFVIIFRHTHKHTTHAWTLNTTLTSQLFWPLSFVLLHEGNVGQQLNDFHLSWL